MDDPLFCAPHVLYMAKSRASYERAIALFVEQGNRQGFISSLATMAIACGAYHSETLFPAATFSEAEEWLHRAHRLAAE